MAAHPLPLLPRLSPPPSLPSLPSLPSRSARSFPERTTLTRSDRVVLRAIAEAMFSHDGEVEPATLDAHLDEVDAFVSAASKRVRSGLRLALFVVRLAPLLLFFRVRPLERLSVDDRVAVLSRLERSRVTLLSLAFVGWRSLMTLVFYESPSELTKLGYTGDERKVYKRRLITVTAAASEPASAPMRVPEAPVRAAEESGVRLRHADDDTRDSEPSIDATQEVA